ncbi:hypothetical protein ACWEKM_41610 [Streptomyces sp. NPDC004752]
MGVAVAVALMRGFARAPRTGEIGDCLRRPAAGHGVDGADPGNGRPWRGGVVVRIGPVRQRPVGRSVARGSITLVVEIRTTSAVAPTVTA